MIIPAPSPLSVDPDAALESALQRARSEIAALGRGRPGLSEERFQRAPNEERRPDHDPEKQIAV